MKFLQTTDHRVAYIEYGGFYTAIDKQELSMVRTQFEKGSLHIGDKIAWWYGGDEEEMIITNATGMDVVQAILFVLRMIIPITNLIWEK